MTFFPDMTTLGFAQLLFFVLAVIGSTHIIVDSNLFSPVREFLATERSPKKNMQFRVAGITAAFFSFVGWLIFSLGLDLVSWPWFVLPFFMGVATAAFWPLNKIVECYQCCGTWVGFFAAFFLIGHHPMVVLLGGGAGSFAAYSAAVMLTYLESQSVVQPSKDHNGSSEG
jgi:hypothetical protein